MTSMDCPSPSAPIATNLKTAHVSAPNPKPTRIYRLSTDTPNYATVPNQKRLIWHTAAYWLMRTVREVIPRPQALASGEFSTIRLRLLKVAVRIRETASRVRLAFAANCPDIESFRSPIHALRLCPT
jgi:hypothetical protein